MLLGAGLATSIGCRAESSCERRADHTVMACLDGAPVTAAEVGEHLGPEASEPRRALDAALRVRLFADEAVRRRLAVPAGGSPARRRAALHQALIRDEAKRQGATAEQIADADAAAAYQGEPGRFNKITATWVNAIIVADPARAAALRAQAEGLDELAFAALARTASEDGSAADGGDLGEAHADGFDPALTRLANDLRATGALGGPVRLDDGRHAILRARAVEMTVKPYDDAMARTVKNQLAHAREQVALDALFVQLTAERRLERFDDELAYLRAP